MRGLSTNEVNKQVSLGNVNITPKPLVKSNKRIVFDHVFNLFNIYNFIIALALVYVQAWSSLFFVVIVSSNTIIRIVQEIRSKAMVAKLTLIVSPKTKVVRDGKLQEISNEEIVLNDCIYLDSGCQIAADCIVLDYPIEVDESLLTGEVDPILKSKGDHLLSGSFVISGATHAKVEHVGTDNYATKIANEARKRKTVTSELIKTFSKVTRFTSMLVLPLSILMLSQALFLREDPLRLTIINTSTALLGMLPIGLILLTSVSLAASVVRLGKKEVLVQEMFSIETLSRIDVLCLDKTGTLTQGKMKVDNVVAINEYEHVLKDILSSFIYGSVDNNATFNTLKEHFSSECVYNTINRVPFSSLRKWSAVELENIGTIVVGAPEIIIPHLKLSDEILNCMTEGSRVLLVAINKDFNTLVDNLHDSFPLAAIIIKDPIRKEAEETIQFFKENNVLVKVISGDNPETVSAIAMSAGIEKANNFVDASQLKTQEELRNAILNYNVIGRATPYQKHQMILELQQHKKKVAMTGDGVNDILALKDADVSIAMGSGSDATKQISQFVIIDGKLNTLIDVVKEGRLDINNITRSASMYYLKTIYTILISIVILFLNIPFPFIPFHMTLMDNFIEGFPSFMIIFEKNINKQKESIGDYCKRYSLPNAIAIVLCVITTCIIAKMYHMTLNDVFFILYFSTFFIALYMIYRIYSPINLYRGFVLVIDIIGFALATWLFWDLLEFSKVTNNIVILTSVITLIGLVLSKLFSILVNNHLKKKSEA